MDETTSVDTAPVAKRPRATRTAHTTSAIIAVDALIMLEYEEDPLLPRLLDTAVRVWIPAGTDAPLMPRSICCARSSVT